MTHPRHASVLAATGLLLATAWLTGCGDPPAVQPGDGGDTGSPGDATPDGPAPDTTAPDQGVDQRPQATVCNGHAELCGRGYDEVAYPTTHNAMSVIELGFGVPNQRHPMEQQLADGVRGMLLDTHYDNDSPRTGVPALCHVNCSLGMTLLSDGLAILKTFMDENPAEVLSLLIENHITNEATEQAFIEAGLESYLFTHELGTPWPTLAEMIDSGRRLVVYAETEGGTPAWYHDLYAVAAETPYSFKTPEELSCVPNRGPVTGELFLVNHFLTNPVASEALAETINHDPLLLDRARQCQKERGMLPNFLAIDFYEIGDLFAAVRALNGLAEEP